jgi:hypothetical protein
LRSLQALRNGEPLPESGLWVHGKLEYRLLTAGDSAADAAPCLDVWRQFACTLLKRNDSIQQLLSCYLLGVTEL